jgi:hypothetical protein
MCPAVASPKSSAIDRRSYSGVSISWGTSTTTVGRVEDRLDDAACIALTKAEISGHIKHGQALACRDEADLARVLRYFAHGQQAAAVEAMARLIVSRRCILLANNEKVLVEHVNSGVTLVRRPGESLIYWTQSERVSID